MRFATIRVGEAIDIDGRKVVPLPANHTVPAVGYQVDSGQGSLVFTGDTGPCPELWQYVNQIRNLRYLIIECAFSNSEKWLAQASLHLCPSMLLDELTNLQRDAEIFITHLKPGTDRIDDAGNRGPHRRVRPGMLQNNQLFEI
jgi:ribonuclease BN (tRNA processing enzyme)